MLMQYPIVLDEVFLLELLLIIKPLYAVLLYVLYIYMCVYACSGLDCIALHCVKRREMTTVLKKNLSKKYSQFNGHDSYENDEEKQPCPHFIFIDFELLLIEILIFFKVTFVKILLLNLRRGGQGGGKL